MAWDEDNYSYAGLKVDGSSVESCRISEAMDFYFAIMQDLNTDDTLTTVPTVDNSLYGIEMKMKNFDTRKEMSDFLGSDAGGSGTTLHQGLLSTDLVGGYPTTKGGSLGQLLSGAEDVNHLFIQSTYSGSGYQAAISPYTRNWEPTIRPARGLPSSTASSSPTTIWRRAISP